MSAAALVAAGALGMLEGLPMPATASLLLGVLLLISGATIGLWDQIRRHGLSFSRPRLDVGTVLGLCLAFCLAIFVQVVPPTAPWTIRLLVALGLGAGFYALMRSEETLLAEQP